MSQLPPRFERAVDYQRRQFRYWAKRAELHHERGLSWARMHAEKQAQRHEEKLNSLLEALCAECMVVR